MAEAVLCLDSGVWIKFLVSEEPAALSRAADQLVQRGLAEGRLVGPAFAWAEVGSVLRKKLRQRLIEPEQMEQLWSSFMKLSIQFLDNVLLRGRAWELARRYQLDTLYDAAYLACTEVALASHGAHREFWTTDEALLRALGENRPQYVYQLETLSDET